MSDQPYFRIATPALLQRFQTKADDEGCGRRRDAAVCVNGEQDVTCSSEIYRGCPQGQTDCADNPRLKFLSILSLFAA